MLLSERHTVYTFLIQRDICEVLDGTDTVQIEKEIAVEVGRRLRQNQIDLGETELIFTIVLATMDFDSWWALPGDVKKKTILLACLIHFRYRAGTCSMASIKASTRSKPDVPLSAGHLSAVVDLMKGKPETEGWTRVRCETFEEDLQRDTAAELQSLPFRDYL